MITMQSHNIRVSGRNPWANAIKNPIIWCNFPTRQVTRSRKRSGNQFLLSFYHRVLLEKCIDMTFLGLIADFNRSRSRNQCIKIDAYLYCFWSLTLNREHSCPNNRFDNSLGQRFEIQLCDCKNALKHTWRISITNLSSWTTIVW